MKCEWEHSDKTCAEETINGETSCVFHLDREEKPGFQEALSQRIKTGNLDFTGFVFPDNFSLEEIRLENPRFSGARFKGYANLSGLVLVKASFDHTIFEKGVKFTDYSVDVFRIRDSVADLRSVIKTTRFEGHTIFTKCDFGPEADFRLCVFKEEVDFYDCIFGNRGAHFAQCRFEDIVYFSGSTFNGLAEFNICTFMDMVNFSWVTFRWDLSFCGAEIHSARFWSLTFESQDSTHKCTVNFSQVTITNLLVFQGELFGPILDFRDCSVSNSGEVMLTRTTLHEALFSDADLERFRFVKVKWPKLRDRRGIYDESFAHTKDKTQSLLETYRKIRLHYEREHEYLLAGDFHVAEMEMRLRREKGIRKFLTRIYGLSSCYGERWQRAFLWVLILWIVPAIMYALVGVEIQGKGVIKFHPSLSLAFLAHPSFWDILKFSLLSLVLQRPDTIALTPLTAFVQLSQMVLGPIQIALFTLTLRRAYQK